MRNLFEAPIKRRSMASYRFLNRASFFRIKKLARALRGLKIIHINSVAYGGGVAELLKNQIPLERGLGLDSRWLVLRAPANFFAVTKKIHNLFQGQSGALTGREKRIYLNFLSKAGRELFKMLELEGDKENLLCVIHDSQPLALIKHLPGHVPVISRMHIDLSAPNRLLLNFLSPFLSKAGRVVVSNKAFRLNGVGKNKIAVSYPAIDPFAKKNRPFPLQKADRVLKKLGVDRHRPLVAQVSRFDRWKDPLGVLEAFFLAKKHIPGLQLILMGSLRVEDDPEAKKVYEEIKKRIKGNGDVFLVTERDIPGLDSDVLVNAVQTGSDVVVQKSIREGFGLTVTEAMWKGRPVIGGNALGVLAQIRHNREGLIVKNAAECSEAIIELLEQPKLAKRFGKNARRRVKENFLMDRLVEDFLKMYSSLALSATGEKKGKDRGGIIDRSNKRA